MKNNKKSSINAGSKKRIKYLAVAPLGMAAGVAFAGWFPDGYIDYTTGFSATASVSVTGNDIALSAATYSFVGAVTHDGAYEVDGSSSDRSAWGSSNVRSANAHHGVSSPTSVALWTEIGNGADAIGKATGDW